MYISHSLGVYIINTSILNGTGIGLLLENVQYQVLISESVISNNYGNLYLINYNNDVSNTTAPSNVNITNTSFNYARNSHHFEEIIPHGIKVH